MLDAFIIEEIQRREERSDRDQPRLEAPSRVPFEPPPHTTTGEHDVGDRNDDQDDNGVIIIDM
jgi:hypothetical protein